MYSDEGSDKIEVDGEEEGEVEKLEIDRQETIRLLIELFKKLESHY